MNYFALTKYRGENCRLMKKKKVSIKVIGWLYSIQTYTYYTHYIPDY